MRDWPILIFTIMFSAGVGLTALVAVFGTVLKNEMNDAELCAILRTPLMAASGLAAVALAVSFAAIGYPLNAPNALRHVTTSNLSREILFASCFIAAVGGATLLALRTGRVSLLLVGAAGVIGLVAVWFMGEIYRNTSVVTWMHPHTHVMFFGGLVVMGAVLGLILVGPALHTMANVVGLRRLFVWTAALVLAALAVKLTVQPFYILAMNANPMSGVVSYPLQPASVFRAHLGLNAVGWATSLIGAAVLLYAAWTGVLKSGRWSFAPVAAAGALLISGEIVGRYVFYAIYG